MPMAHRPHKATPVGVHFIFTYAGSESVVIPFVPKRFVNSSEDKVANVTT